jgi:hypothetical protein
MARRRPMACFMRTHHVQVGRVAGLTKPARARFTSRHGSQLFLHQVGQGQVLEEEFHELFLAEFEDELVHALAVLGGLAAAPAAAALAAG